MISSRAVARRATSGLLEGAESFSSSSENGLDSAVDVRLVPVLDMIGEEASENLTFLFFVDKEGVSHSPPVSLTGIFIICSEDEYGSPSRRQQCDIVTRGCSVGKGSDELASQHGSGDVGKEPRHKYCVSLRGRYTSVH